jgi:hypothetical protein
VNRRSSVCKGLLLLVTISVCIAAFLRWVWFPNEYVFLTVEESSINALSAWPLGFNGFPEVFIDVQEKALALSQKKSLSGVCLGIYYSASSQGVEFNERLLLSRTGRLSLNLPAPVSLMVPNIQGQPVELVNNQARVLSGRLQVVKTARDGTVHLKYGSKAFTLRPGESWAELLVLDPRGTRAVSEGAWGHELETCFQMGYPATRLAISNRGLWPKSGVKVGMYQ